MQNTELNVENEVYTEVISGLLKTQKELPSKLFYDEKGSKLFDKICRLDEYYPTRTELMLMKNNIEDIISTLCKDVVFIEYGSGSSLKTRLLLSNMTDISVYVPIDISEEHLLKTVASLEERYPGLHIIPVSADYTKPFDLPEIVSERKVKTGYFPGSTIGNFTREEALKFLKKTAGMLGENGSLLIGIDLIKDRDVLIAAYNDSKGITAEFNLNILEHLNREYNFDFKKDNFYHKAIFNEEAGRIEMYLISKKEQVVTSGDYIFMFREGESILTEYSHKYTIDGFMSLVSDFYKLEKYWTDDKNYFGLLFLKTI